MWHWGADTDKLPVRQQRTQGELCKEEERDYLCNSIELFKNRNINEIYWNYVQNRSNSQPKAFLIGQDPPHYSKKKNFFLIKESRIGRDPPTSLSEKLKKNSFSLCLSQYHHTGAVKWSLEGFHFQLNHPMDLVSTMQNQSYFRWSLWSGVFLPFVKSLLRDDPLLANQSASPRPWANFEVLPVVAWLYRVL